MLAVLLRKQIITVKLQEIENKLDNHNQDKYITTTEFNTVADDVFDARLAQAHLVPKTDFDNNVSSLDSKIAENKTKKKSIDNEWKRLKTFHASYFIGKCNFEEDGTKNYLVFQTKIWQVIAVIEYVEYVSEWKSNGLYSETIKSIVTSDDSLKPKLIYYGSKIRVTFAGSCLK